MCRDSLRRLVTRFVRAAESAGQREQRHDQPESLSKHSSEHQSVPSRLLSTPKSLSSQEIPRGEWVTARAKAFVATLFVAESYGATKPVNGLRSEEHTSELQSQSNLVCRLLLE